MSRSGTMICCSGDATVDRCVREVLLDTRDVESLGSLGINMVDAVAIPRRATSIVVIFISMVAGG